MKAADAADYVLGVVGAGAMGQGIVQVAAMGGIRVLLQDARDGGAKAWRDAVAARINRLEEKGRIDPDAAAAAIARIEPVNGMPDLASADAVVEAVFEDLDVKQQVFAALEGVVGPECILASNTSSIPIAAIARACKHPSRVAGLHFFNPVPLMKLVEVIRAAETTEAVVAALTTLGRRMTRTPVTVKDRPGFLVNLGGRAFTTEGLRIAHDGIATPAQIDAIMRDCWGFRMGPFELMDLTGIDVNYPVSQIVWDGYQCDPRLATSPNHKAMFDAGLFGRKTGKGWYTYDGGKPVDPPSPDHDSGAEPVQRVALVPGAEAGREALAELCDTLGIDVITDDGGCTLLGDAGGPAPGRDASHAAVMAGVDAARLVCVDLMGDTSRRMTLMTAPGADAAHLGGVAAAIAASGRKVTAINDSPGFVGPRLCAMIANLGCFMAEIALADPEDIDMAMELGLNYPAGPLKLASDMGPANVLAIMQALQEVTGDPRYRPTPWLRRRAMLGLAIHTRP
ncbi:MAG: 3-hydroxyacyl-CoA dehydrogenase [Pseudomonadota bacterium]